MAIEREELTTTRRTTAAPFDEVAEVEQTDMVATDPYSARRDAAYRVNQAIYLVFGVIESLIAIRFVLRLLGANESAGFTSFIYGVTRPLVAPFSGIFGTPATGGNVLEPESIVALIVYPLVAWLLTAIVRLVLNDRRTGVRASRVNTRIR